MNTRKQIFGSWKALVFMASCGLASLIAGDMALANDYSIKSQGLQCNRRQTKCMFVTNQVTIGDEVGVFNDSGELIARGRIKGMRNQRRAMVVIKRHGRIQRDHNLALLNRNADGKIERRFRVYKRPSNTVVGASLGMATLGIGEGTPALDISVFGGKRRWGVQWIGRASYLNAEGEVSRTQFEGIETRPVSVKGLGLLGGAAFTARESRTIGFRGELGAGFMYAQADVAGDPGLADDGNFDVRINNGFGKMLRGSASVLWNVGTWHVDLSISPTVAHDAFGTTLSGGLIKRLD